MADFDAQRLIGDYTGKELNMEQAPIASGPLEASVMALEWSVEHQPNDDCHYSHVLAETPFGRFLISWKGWKDHDSPTIDETPWGEFGGAFFGVDDAKAAAQAEYSRRVILCLRPSA